MRLAASRVRAVPLQPIPLGLRSFFPFLHLPLTLFPVHGLLDHLQIALRTGVGESRSTLGGHYFFHLLATFLHPFFFFDTGSLGLLCLLFIPLFEFGLPSLLLEHGTPV